MSMLLTANTTVEWRPHAHNGLCAFTATVGEATSLLLGVEHNANTMVSHGLSFTLFRQVRARPQSDHQWEKVLAAQIMLQREECRWLFHIDADAIVVDVNRDPERILRRLEADAAPAAPIVFATCNSPLGSGFDCDIFCCGRARDGASCCAHERKRPQRCRVGLHDVGPASPYPCMINSGVWFMKNAPAARELVQAWEVKQTEHPEIFGEQASLNELKEAQPGLVDVVGGQVMNTPAAFHSRFARAGAEGRCAYDLALRITSGYEPEVQHDARLNQTLYRRAVLSLLGAPLASDRLQNKLTSHPGECAEDPNAFICHPFARPLEQKQALATQVATAKRHALERRLRLHQQLGYTSLTAAAAGTPAAAGASATLAGQARWQRTASSAVAVHEPASRPEHPARALRRAEKPADAAASGRRGGSNSDHLTAVCIAGALRTFLQPPVQQAFADNLHHEGYEYFVSTDAPQPTGDAAATLRLRPLRAWLSMGHGELLDTGRPNTPTRDELPRGRCPRGTCNPFRFLQPFAARLTECFYAMQARALCRRLVPRRSLTACPHPSTHTPPCVCLCDARPRRGSGACVTRRCCACALTTSSCGACRVSARPRAGSAHPSPLAAS